MNKIFRSSTHLLMAVLLVAGLASTATAAGTSAGIPISNTASLTYDVGGTPQPPLAPPAPAVFVVDNKVDLTLSGANTLGVNGTGQALVFTITNTGNEDQDYQVTWYAETTADDWDMTSVALYLDDGTTAGVWDPADTPIQAAPTVSGTYYPIGVDVPEDGSVDVLLVGNTPAGVQTNDIATYTLVAQTLNASTHPTAPGAITTDPGGADDPNAVDVVLADGTSADTPADTVPGGTDIDRDGKFLATADFVFTGAGVSVAKTAVALWDPFNGSTNPKAIPGAYIQYSITVSNAGGSPSSTLQTINDLLQAELAHDPDLSDGSVAPVAPPAVAVHIPEDVAGNGFKVTHISGRNVLVTPATQYFTTAADLDGVDISGQTITANFTTILPAEAGYLAGELLGGESVTLTFNAIIQ